MFFIKSFFDEKSVSVEVYLDVIDILIFLSLCPVVPCNNNGCQNTKSPMTEQMETGLGPIGHPVFHGKRLGVRTGDGQRTRLSTPLDY